MKPVTFPEQNIVLGKDQPEFLPLPAYRSPCGKVVSCWKLSLWDRLKLLVTGRFWLIQLTGGDVLQPQLPQVEYPFSEKLGVES